VIDTLSHEEKETIIPLSLEELTFSNEQLERETLSCESGERTAGVEDLVEILQKMQLASESKQLFSLERANGTGRERRDPEASEKLVKLHSVKDNSPEMTAK
jgi:hypothetical protein